MNFAWSYSRLKNFESCAHKYKSVDIDKLFGESTPELTRGEQLHLAMYERVANGVKLPPQFGYMEMWAKRLTAEVHPQQETFCELKLALTGDYTPCEFMGKKVWCRARLDYVKIIPEQAHVVDYKTGKPRTDDAQLAICAAMIFHHYPEVQKIRTEFIWTEYGDTSHRNFHRDDLAEIWEDLLPRVWKLQKAHEDDEFQATPNGLCARYCPVNTCKHWGTRFRR